MPAQKASTEQIVAAYRETGSIWKAAKSLGMAGQTVHERLRRAGIVLHGQRWTEAELDEMRALAAEDIPLGEIARRLGRPFGGAAGKASEIGLRFGHTRRRRRIPRGAGYDKVAMTRHMRALEAYAGSVTQYARSQGLNVEPFVQACQRHFPERWEAYVREHSDLPVRVCEYCRDEFIPNSGKQRFCDRHCAGDARRDAAYFGGRRRETVGLAEGICQLCGRRPKRGLSSHHIYGKENDPDNAALIALCSGCHKLVTMLAACRVIDTPGRLEDLISLAWMRRNGSRLVKIERQWALWTCVDIEIGWDEE